MNGTNKRTGKDAVEGIDALLGMAVVFFKVASQSLSACSGLWKTTALPQPWDSSTLVLLSRDCLHN